MGIVIIGGLISSLFLTLIIVPSVYGYVDDFRLWLRRLIGADEMGQTPVKTVKAKR
jgi:hypothetical protein